MRRPIKGEFFEAAIRARALMILLGYHSQKDFVAKVLGDDISYERWNNIVRGIAPFSYAVQQVVRDRINPRITGDWMRYGREDGLPSGLMLELRAAVAQARSLTRNGTTQA